MKNLCAALMAVFFMLTTVGCGDDVEADPATTDVAVEVSEDAGASEGEGEDVGDTDTGDDNTSDDSDTNDSSENGADGE